MRSGGTEATESTEGTERPGVGTRRMTGGCEESGPPSTARRSPAWRVCCSGPDGGHGGGSLVTVSSSSLPWRVMTQIFCSA